MSKKKTKSIQQTAVQKVLEILHAKKAYSEKTAVGYDAFKNMTYPTQVIAYTLANLMENEVVKRTEDERFYFVEENWNKLKKKISLSNYFFLGLPLIIFLIFLLIKWIF